MFKRGWRSHLKWIYLSETAPDTPLSNTQNRNLLYPEKRTSLRYTPYFFRKHIDLIHSNFVSVCTGRSIAVEIADRLPVYSIVYDLVVSPFPDRIEYRNFKKFSNITFRADLKRENWELVLNSNDFNMSLS